METVLANFLDAIYNLFAPSSATRCELQRVTTKDTVEDSFAVPNGAFAGFAVAFTTATGHSDYLLRFRYSGEPLDSRIDSFGGGNKNLQLLASEAIPMIRGASGFRKKKKEAKRGGKSS